jgi:hypothetical protein
MTIIGKWMRVTGFTPEYNPVTSEKFMLLCCGVDYDYYVARTNPVVYRYDLNLKIWEQLY